MRLPNDETQGRRLRIGSLFSGYGGLDLAVEEVFDGETVWFSELSPAPARVFAYHWPGVPNLGDITTIDWNAVEPVDVICGGFPCQDVSTVGRMAGLHPGTRSGLWARMAEAIDVLQPEWVVAENVRGLLSATATRPTPEGEDPDGRNPASATPEPATAIEGGGRSRCGIRPVASGRPASSTSTGSWRRTRRSGRPRVRRALARPTRFRHRRTPHPLSHLHPRPPRCSARRWPPTPPAAGRAWNEYARGAARSPCPIRSSTWR
ncbi:DNA (cytosine-5-)-methyltransferase [Janibacter hoylei PVAS-1]|uniref:DNA (cytosine-5-)-methyltransferase n=1 Tax=Janibacter hoylei PVAS-1 TaxID=1210046 RepID=K1EQI1_9MICO|nr:DNA (cytosine-5-)-methyltransferase [Janibacter hoylei PVAS-1]